MCGLPIGGVRQTPMSKLSDPPANPNYLPGDGTIHESFASVLWKQQAGEALRANIQHILAGPYADRIMGIPSPGPLWRMAHLPASNLLDVAAPMLTYFRSYLQSKYNGDVEALRAAWNWPYVTFETAPFPTSRTDHAHFRSFQICGM